MHKEVKDFILRMKEKHPGTFSKVKRVFEAGSLDVNGSCRQFFGKDVKYIGLDWRKGPGVDIVSLMHEYDNPKHLRSFDLVLSTEMLEHDPYWRESVWAMLDLVRKGGSFLITCASFRRHAHNVETSPKKGHYMNVPPEMLTDAILSKSCFKWIELESDTEAGDVRFFGRKKLW